ncbi:MAG: hypothetical protein AAF767_00900, partial [Pseudomonadota bacterium]
AFSQMLHRLSGRVTIILATQRPSLLRQADLTFELTGKTGRVLPTDPSQPVGSPRQEKAS